MGTKSIHALVRVQALCLVLTAGSVQAESTNFVVFPESDTFVRSAAPTNNYGGAGALSVSGSEATNASGLVNGSFDSLLRFPMNDLVASIDSAFGTHSWLVISATLRLTEQGAPANALFDRGVGAFAIRWITADSWLEGSGTPNAPTGDGINYDGVASLLALGSVALGQFTNRGTDGPLSFNLALAPAFLADIQSGGAVTLYLTAVSAQVGFTVDSRSFGTASARPALEITAAPIPPPQILKISSRQADQVSLAFDTLSNWNYALQYSDGLPLGAGGWSNLATVSARETNGYSMFVDGVTNRARLYRLALFP